MLHDSKQEFRKIVSKAESNRIRKLKVYEFSSVKDVGGGQATYNIPSELFDLLIENKIIFKSDLKFTGRNNESGDIYQLEGNYKLEIGETLQRLIGYTPSKPLGFLIVEGNGNKPQIRKSYFKEMLNDKEQDYNWFVKLFDNNSQDSVMIYRLDKDLKILQIDLELKKENFDIERIIISEETPVYNVTNFEYMQKIYFGAPGTGKSFKVSRIIESFYPDFEENGSEYVFRTTIHPDFGYYDFIGNILPKVDNNDKTITYEFVEGIFTRALIKALSCPNKAVFLVLEEMTRGNIASIFGDIFQILDRNSFGVSEYKVENKYIGELLIKENLLADFNISLPCNLNILGTINTSDQNLYVMDTAFKRRFDFEYIDINPVKDNKGQLINNYLVNIGGKDIKWCDFLNSLNNFIILDLNLTEDKQIGQFFVNLSTNNDKNNDIFKNKVLYYLWNDVHKISNYNGNDKSLFRNEIKSYSKLISTYNNNERIFNDDIYSNIDRVNVENEVDN